MKIVIDDSEIEELLIEDIIKSNDRGLVLVKGEMVGKRNESKDELIKEIIAYDAIELGPSRASEIHDVPISSASKYSDGKDISDPDAKSRILSARHEIADVAVTKLMESLNLINVSEIEKMKDKVSAVSQLANIVDKITPQSKEGGNAIHLHLYAPKQKSLESYQTIDV